MCLYLLYSINIAFVINSFIFQSFTINLASRNRTGSLLKALGRSYFRSATYDFRFAVLYVVHDFYVRNSSLVKHMTLLFRVIVYSIMLCLLHNLLHSKKVKSSCL